MTKMSRHPEVRDIASLEAALASVRKECEAQRQVLAEGYESLKESASSPFSLGGAIRCGKEVFNWGSLVLGVVRALRRRR